MHCTRNGGDIVDNIWDWLMSLDSETRFIVMGEIMDETMKKGRPLNEEELNEIRAKYEKNQEGA